MNQTLDQILLVVLIILKVEKKHRIYIIFIIMFHVTYIYIYIYIYLNVPTLESNVRSNFACSIDNINSGKKTQRFKNWKEEGLKKGE